MINQAMLRAIAFVVCISAWTGALLMLVPHQSASEVLGGDRGVFLFGKTLHVCAYAFLTVLGGSMMLARRQRWLLLAGLSFHTFATEFLQQFVGRGASLRDVGLDHIGIMFGIVLGWYWWRALLPRPSETVI